MIKLIFFVVCLSLAIGTQIYSSYKKNKRRREDVLETQRRMGNRAYEGIERNYRWEEEREAQADNIIQRLAQERRRDTWEAQVRDRIDRRIRRTEPVEINYRGHRITVPGRVEYTSSAASSSIPSVFSDGETEITFCRDCKTFYRLEPYNAHKCKTAKKPKEEFLTEEEMEI